MIQTALIRLNQPVSYSSSVQLNIYTAFRPWANTADLESIPGPIQKQPVNNTIIQTITK